MTLILICVVLIAAVCALQACSPSPISVLDGKLTNLTAHATYENGDTVSEKLSSCKGEGNGSFTLLFDEERTFNRAFIALSGEAEMEISANGKTLYTGKDGYVAFPSVTASELKIDVTCEGKWSAESIGVYNAPAAKSGQVVSVNAGDLLSGAFTAEDFDGADLVILRANAFYDTAGAVHFADVNGTGGEEYFAASVNALKALTSARIYMQADVMYTDGVDPVAESAHLRYTALRTHKSAAANNLNAAVRKYGLQGLHLDFSDTPADGTSLYMLSEFAAIWKSCSGGKLSVAMRLDGMERSEKLDKLMSKIFRDGNLGGNLIEKLLLTSSEMDYKQAAEIAELNSEFPVAAAIDCNADVSVFTFANDCGISAALVNFNKAGADALNMLFD